MIVKELASAFQVHQDHVFFVYIHMMQVQQLLQKQKTDIEARLLLEEISYENGENAKSFAFYSKEKKFIDLHTRLEDFFRKGNPSLSDFAPKPKDVDLNERTLRALPAFIAEWNASSRRVFQLSSEMQRLLEETSYEELERDDLIIPFPSFIVKLADGILYEGHVTTAIGFSEEKVVEESLDFSFNAWGYVLMRECQKWQPLSKREKEKFLKDAHKSKKLSENVRRVFSRMEQIWDEGNFAPLIRIANTQKLTPNAGNVGGTLSSNFVSHRRIHSIMVNLMAILSRMSKGNSGAHPLVPCDTSDVTSTENVFDIGSVSSLGDMVDLRSSQGGTNEGDFNDRRKITPHWRRKHARRHPGMGHIPDAPKDVIIPATLVLGDFLKAGQLPIGNITKM